MRRAGPVCAALVLLCASRAAAVSDLMLTTDCEDGFRRLIHMAQAGQLGADVTNANVGIEKTRARVELVGDGAPLRVLLLEPSRSPRSLSRYFDVTPSDGASEGDARRLAQALDEIFLTDPFEISVLERSPGNDRIPGLGDAWADGGWRGVRRAIEWRLMALASLEYTAGVIVVLALSTMASLVLLWGSSPPR